MNWKNILSAGVFSGALLGIFISIVFILVGVDPGSFRGLFSIFLAMAILSAIVVNQILKTTRRPELNLKILVPIGFLTSIIPLLGATFGAPNSEPITLVTIVLLGAIGGLFWSSPFALWNAYHHSKNDADSEA